MDRRTCIVVIPLSLAVLLFPSIVSAHPAHVSANTIVQRSTQAMRSVRGSHSDAMVMTSRVALQGSPAQTISAHTSADCTGSRTSTHFTSAIRAAVSGTAVVGTAKPSRFTVHYIILSSGATTGVGVHTTLWERDAKTHGRWQRETTFVQQMAYIAMFESQPCPGGGIFRETQLPGAHLQPPVKGTSQNQPVWVLRGTSGSNVERFTFRILVDQSTYRLNGFKNHYVERINSRVEARQQISTVYSGYDTP